MFKHQPGEKIHFIHKRPLGGALAALPQPNLVRLSEAEHDNDHFRPTQRMSQDRLQIRIDVPV